MNAQKSVLDNGLQRIAQRALGAKGEEGIQAHDDAAFDLINKYVLSEARFDEKDADAVYNKYLGYAGVDLEQARTFENEEIPEGQDEIYDGNQYQGKVEDIPVNGKKSEKSASAKKTRA
jgi:hypothetical protein